MADFGKITVTASKFNDSDVFSIKHESGQSFRYAYPRHETAKFVLEKFITPALGEMTIEDHPDFEPDFPMSVSAFDEKA